MRWNHSDHANILVHWQWPVHGNPTLEIILRLLEGNSGKFSSHLCPQVGAIRCPFVKQVGTQTPLFLRAIRLLISVYCLLFIDISGPVEWTRVVLWPCTHLHTVVTDMLLLMSGCSFGVYLFMMYYSFFNERSRL